MEAVGVAAVFTACFMTGTTSATGLRSGIHELQSNNVPSSTSASLTSQCGILRDCGACIRNPGCGFCASTETCMPGDEDGPLGPDCPSYDTDGQNDPEESLSGWDWGQCSVLKPCADFESCADCTATPRCGWCPSNPEKPELVGCYDFVSSTDAATGKLNWLPPDREGWCPVSSTYMRTLIMLL